MSLRWGSFLDAARLAGPGDFLYIDPPYAPLSGTSNFTSYTSPRFGAEEQQALQQMAIALSQRGCHVLLSNSTAPAIADLYDTNPDAQDAGLRGVRVPARRAINSNAARRGPVDEYVITNVPGSEYAASIDRLQVGTRGLGPTCRYTISEASRGAGWTGEHRGKSPHQNLID